MSLTLCYQSAVNGDETKKQEQDGLRSSEGRKEGKCHGNPLSQINQKYPVLLYKETDEINSK